MTIPKILIFRRNNEIRTVVPDHHPHALTLMSAFAHTLSYYKKELVPTTIERGGMEIPTGEREVKKHKEILFRSVLSPIGTQISTFQGLFPEVLKVMNLTSTPYTVLDARRPALEVVPENAKDFRFGQEGVFRTLLATRDSGSVVLPTRYGKSYIMKNLIVAHPHSRILMVMPGVDLLQQQATFMEQWIPHKDIGKVYGSALQADRRVVFASLDSLHKMTDLQLDAFDLVIGDEIHAAGAPERIPQLGRIRNARILGLTATPKGRFDNADIIVRGIFGPPLVHKTYAEAVAEGAICQIVVYSYKVDVTSKEEDMHYGTRLNAYRHGHYLNAKRRELLKQLLEDVIPPSWQTLVFIDTNKQADYLSKVLEVPHQLAIAGRFKGKKDRAATNDAMASGEVKRCLATGIYSQGVTFSSLRCMVNYSGGGGSITSIQKPGRLAEVIAGKKCGYMIDLNYVAPPGSTLAPGVAHLVRDSAARRKVYRDLGYTIIDVTDTEQIKLD